MLEIPFASQRVAHVNPPVGVSQVVDSIRDQQHGELCELDKVLLNSEPFAAGWQSMFSQIRYNNTVPGDIRELMAGVCSNAGFNVDSNAPPRYLASPLSKVRPTSRDFTRT
ncbi:hypothetical protein FRC12_016151 [Ceratobasidium sp. 428]|nr:hypothetical protein FRC12_016151 [Ceratobasidium sp. 428]